MSQNSESSDSVSDDRRDGGHAPTAKTPESHEPRAAVASASSLREQFRNNWLALLSLVIALFGLGYNTYRNETTERQRNVRDAGFVVLGALGELQQLADTRFFGGERSQANRIAIWGRVVLVRDVSELVSASAKSRGDELFETWSGNAAAFDDGDAAAEKAFADATRKARSQVLADLRRLR